MLALFREQLRARLVLFLIVCPLLGAAAATAQTPPEEPKEEDSSAGEADEETLQTTLTLFILELDSELVFVGDGGSTEASRPSRRQGIEWANFYPVNDWVTVDLDATLTDAELTDGDPAGDQIPGAVGRTVAAGISLGEGRKLFGGLRWRYFGDAALIEDGSVRSSSSSLVNGRIGYAFPNGLRLELDAFNLLDSEASDIQYFYASRLPGEPEEGVEDIHFHPMEKRSVRLTATWRLARR